MKRVVVAASCPDQKEGQTQRDSSPGTGPKLGLSALAAAVTMANGCAALLPSSSAAQALMTPEEKVCERPLQCSGRSDLAA